MSLVVTAAGQTWVMDAGFVAGRGPDAAVHIDDQFASSKHAGFDTDGIRWYVGDLGSTNGTYQNGIRVYGPSPVSRGDKIKVGRTILTVVPT